MLDEETVHILPLAKRSGERFGLRTKKAKYILQEVLRTQAVRSMAESAKRKQDGMKEHSATAAFSRPEAEGLPGTAQVFATIRRSHLAFELKKARTECAELFKKKELTEMTLDMTASA